MKKWIGKNTQGRVVGIVEFETMRELFNKIQEKFIPFEHLTNFFGSWRKWLFRLWRIFKKVDEELNNLTDDELRLLILTSTSEAYYQEFIEE